MKLALLLPLLTLSCEGVSTRTGPRRSLTRPYAARNGNPGDWHDDGGYTHGAGSHHHGDGDHGGADHGKGAHGGGDHGGGDHGGGDHGGGDHGGGDHGGGDHGGDHGDHNCDSSGTDCNTGDTLTWIMDNPDVTTNLTIPDTVNNGTLPDLVTDGTIPTTNTTAESLGGMLPAFMNGSEPATSFGGVTIDGMNDTMIRPLQGTNQNAPTLQSVMSLNSREVVAANKRQDGGIFQPNLPPLNPDVNLQCDYSYEHVLGGGGTTSKGALWALEGYVDLVAADVMQGSIGDCGIGASIQALVSGGWTRYVKSMFVQAVTGDMFTANFKKDGVTYPVVIDDQLPVRQNVNPNCWPYLGYQPVNDAALPSPDGSYPPTPIFFVPLFEKAFANFLDNVASDWRAAPAGTTGYPGLEGVNPQYVLAAITGGTPKATWRTRPGFDSGILGALITCMRGLAPCVISTTDALTLSTLGTETPEGAIWLNPAGDEASPLGYTPGTTAGMLASDAPTSKSTYTVIDFDQVQATPEGDRSTAITMVGNHAYAFEWTRSAGIPFTSGLEAARMRILNPWGSNPCQWPGGCGGKGAFSDAAEVTLSFRALAESVIGVFTVENMPAL